MTRSVVLSLGAGLSLLVAVALADASRSRAHLAAAGAVAQLLRARHSQGDYAAIVKLVQAQVPGAALEQAPMLRGRLVRLKETPVEQIKAPPEASWVLNGDRGLTYAEGVPEAPRS